MGIYNDLDRWTHHVRIATRKEMYRLRHSEEEAAQAFPLTMEERVDQHVAAARRWYVELRRVARQGLPAVERFIMRLINPNVAPERLLPDSPLHR
jgi:hypothetical protein